MESDTSSDTLTEVDAASQSKSREASHWQLVSSHALLTPAVLNHKYHGSGTEEDPYRVEFIPNDPRDPMGFTMWKKWAITLLVAFATLAVAFVSSAYTGGVDQIIMGLDTSDEVVVLGVSLFVLGVSTERYKSERKQVSLIYSSPLAPCCGLLCPSFMAGKSSSSPPTASLPPSTQEPLALKTYKL